MIQSKLFKITFVAICVFVFGGNANAQEPDKKSLIVIPRAKALGFVAIEDLWARSFSAGVEFLWKEKWSLVTDVVHYRRKEEEEVYPIPGNYEDYDEYALYDARNYMAFEIRHYPQFLNFDSNIKFYIGGLSKIGKRHLHVQEEYPIMINQTFRLNGTIRDAGGLIGFCGGENFGIDLSIGAAHRWERKWEDILLEDDEIQFTSNIPDNKWRAVVRASFYFRF